VPEAPVHEHGDPCAGEHDIGTDAQLHETSLKCLR
jgi:hypothetical protein